MFAGIRSIGSAFTRLVAATVVVGAVTCAAVLPAQLAQAATDTVMTSAGSGPGSLPAVVGAASSGDTITFSAFCPASSPITLSSTIDIDTNLTIEDQAPTDVVVSGNNAVEVFDVISGTVSISGLTIENGSASQGGGLANNGTLAITNTTLTDNEGSNTGGAIVNNGSLSISDSSLSGNTADEGGGAIMNFGGTTISNSTLSDNYGDYGGGVQNLDRLNISDSTLSNNTCGQGCGIYNQGGATTVNTSTLSANGLGSGPSGASQGGGIFVNYGSATITASTFSGNGAPRGQGGALYNAANGATVSLAATIVASSSSGGDCSGPISDAGYNLDDDGSCGFSATNHSLSDTDAYLGPLNNNGGLTDTQAPALGSPALDQIPFGTTANGVTLCPGTDQRGVPRPQAGRCDIGAVELVMSQAITSPDAAVGTPGSPFSFTVTTSGTPVPSITEKGTLPNHLRFTDNGNGTATISGTPKKSGVTDLTIKATFGAGSTSQYVASQAFTLIFPSGATVIPQYSGRSCIGNQDLLAWPGSDAGDLTGYQIDFSDQDLDPPEQYSESVGPATTVLRFTLPPELLQLTIYTIISGEVSSSPLGSTSVFGAKGPASMLWVGPGNSIGEHSATVSFQWSEELSIYENTGEINDTFLVTASPSGGTQTPSVSYPTATATFKGLTPGVAYTFTESISNACDTAGVSTRSPTFTPGLSPTLTGTPSSPATQGEHYRFPLAVGGDPTPTVTVTSGALPPGLSISSAAVISGTPTTPGTYSATVTAENGVGFVGAEPDATDSFTIQVVA